MLVCIVGELIWDGSKNSLFSRLVNQNASFPKFPQRTRALSASVFKVVNIVINSKQIKYFIIYWERSKFFSLDAFLNCILGATNKCAIYVRAIILVIIK
jgi:hypothetical protein